ncbi:MAG: hypothetical protein MJE68_15405 [Proteobacteria bacterium]|nr:hypothetical protein [Pseudomonadota bacterium]
MDSNSLSLSFSFALSLLLLLLLQDVLYSFPASATSIAVHPLSPCYIAFALGDGSVRLLDRRMTKDHVGNMDLPDLADKAMVKRYKPHTIGTQPHKITSVQFNTVGSELLVSYSEDYVYLFSNRLFHVGPVSRDTAVTDSSAFLSRPTYLSQLERYSSGHRRNRSSFVKRKPLSNHDDSPPPTSSSSKPAPKVDSVPPAKKLRLRGDWSDTGPEARPEVNSEGGEGGGEEGGGGGREGGHLMNRMSRMFAQWIDMSLNPDRSSSSSSSNRGAVPSRYRNRRSRRVPPPPPPHHDGVSPGASSATSSSNDSFHLFDSDSNEAEVEEGDGERGESEHPATLDSKEDDIFPLAVESPNGSAVKSEGVATMDASTVSERSTPPSPDLAEVGEKKVLLSPIELQNSDERSDTKEETSSVVDTEATFTLSDGEREKSSDSRDSKHDFRTRDASSPINESESEQSSQVDSSVASNVTVTIESRTKNSSPDSAPAVVVEGQTDSDDTCEEGGSCDESHDTQKRSHDDRLLCSQYFMRYKGHRNSRTMV